MSFNLGMMGGVFLGWASSLVFWALLILFLFSLFILFLIIKRKLKFVYPCLEIISLGQGKISVNVSKAGWFKKNKNFFNLIETGGEQELICKNGNRKIFCASSVDYHEINGKRGIICKRKDDDPEVLVPISKVNIENLDLLLRIAPADYRDAAEDILEKKKQEVLTWVEKNLPLIISLTVFIFGLVALIIVFNFAKQESSAWRAFANSARTGIRIINSTAP